jgi:hypothetical protein
MFLWQTRDRRDVLQYFNNFGQGGWRTLSHALDRKLKLGAAPFDRAKRKGAVLESLSST